MVCSVIGVPKSIDNDILLVSTRSVTPRAGRLCSACALLWKPARPLCLQTTRVCIMCCVCAHACVDVLCACMRVHTRASSMMP